MIRRKCLRVAVVAVGLALACQAAAVTVHTWIDAAGVRHFADAPPGAGLASEELVLSDTPPSTAADDYYSIGRQWERMRAERAAKDAQARERARIDAAARAAEQPPVYIESPPRTALYPPTYGYPIGFGPTWSWPASGEDVGPPSARNAKVNATPPVWPRNR
jgi:hypothetical protein